ncbi:MAG: hypothetical protein DLM64_00960 [Solirubrobacterales bacterium]|nr:MAG: hypothetical protein DLM64_00960 [Solirubrobacterales bacterium]
MATTVDLQEVLPLELGIELSQQGTTSTVQLRGEIDLAAQPAIRDAISEVLARAPECLVLDLTGVSFIDVSGVRAVIEATKRSYRDNVRLVIVPVPEAVQRVFDFCQLTATLPFVR